MADLEALKVQAQKAATEPHDASETTGYLGAANLVVLAPEVFLKLLAVAEAAQALLDAVPDMSAEDFARYGKFEANLGLGVKLEQALAALKAGSST